jgi:hypothetical protein
MGTYHSDPVQQDQHRIVGQARIPTVRETTRRLRPPPPVAPPVFVDDTGRRGRFVTLATSLLVLLVVAGVAVFWISQVTHL